MCTVQVALFAEVSGFGPSRRPIPPRRICRRLFAADDSSAESSSACLRRLEKEIELGVRQRWNFDFRAGEPLPGRYQWVTVGEDRTQTIKTTSKVDENAPPKRRKGAQTTPVQSKITDFLQQRRKRPLESDSLCPKKALKTVATSHGGSLVVTID